jgi:hypothetical protein
LYNSLSILNDSSSEIISDSKISGSTVEDSLLSFAASLEDSSLFSLSTFSLSSISCNFFLYLSCLPFLISSASLTSSSAIFFWSSTILLFSPVFKYSSLNSLL